MHMNAYHLSVRGLYTKYMCPDSLPSLWRYINQLLTYLLTHSHMRVDQKLKIVQLYLFICLIFHLVTLHKREMKISHVLGK